jgi:ethanolamine permease
MYLALVLGMAELSSALPAAGGGYTFARRALGPWGGFATGTAILIEYSIAPAAIATFIGAYVESLGLFGIQNGWWVYLVAYAIFIGIHLSGVGEALKVMFVITAVALVGLVVFAIAAVGSFDAANLTDIAPTDAAGASSLLPFGYLGIWAAIPFAIWFFLAIEGVPLAAEETANPERNVPRGIIAAMGVLLVTCVGVLVLATGAGGAEAMSESGNPLVEALGSSTAATVVNYIGLAGLIASFFSIIYAYSRQLFALSRAGYLPTALSVTNSRKAPTLALIVPGVIGFALSLTGKGDLLLNMAVFGAAVSYVLMMVSHIVLRRREPTMSRPYRTPGGVATTGFALVIASLAVIATFLVDTIAALCCLAVFAAFLLYFALVSRKRLVANSPDEEFAMLAQAEGGLT